MRYIRIFLLLFGVLYVTTHLSAAPFTDVYVFGDSLSGTGNMLEVSKDQLPNPLSGPPYFEGRASNGPIYIDFLAPLLGGDSLASELGGTNYAYGGARTNFHPFATGFPLPGGLPPFPGISGPKSIREQVDQFTTDVSGSADPNAFYIMFGGSNNIQTALQVASNAAAMGQDPVQAAQAVVGDAVADIGQMLQDLVGVGAQEILVVNVPNVGRVPRILEVDQVQAGTAALATVLSIGFNDALDQVLTQLSLQTGDAVEFIPFDLFGQFEQLFVDETLLGLSLANITERCYTGDDILFTGGGEICANPDEYLFWDGIHPTTEVHRVIASEMQAAIQAPAAIPEPPLWLLLLPGLTVLIVRARLQ